MDQCSSFFQISIVKFKMSMYAFDSFDWNVQTSSFTPLPLKGHTVNWHNHSVCLYMSVCCFICVKHVCVWYIHTFSILFLLLCTFYVIFLIHQHVHTHNVSQYMIRLLVEWTKPDYNAVFLFGHLISARSNQVHCFQCPNRNQRYYSLFCCKSI